MDNISAILISKALDGLSMRQAYLAQNIANANSPDYMPVNVEFETALTQAVMSKDKTNIANVNPKIRLRNNVFDTPELRLDLELAESSQTAMRYSALVEVLSRQMSLTRSIIQGGAQ